MEGECKNTHLLTHSLTHSLTRAHPFTHTFTNTNTTTNTQVCPRKIWIDGIESALEKRGTSIRDVEKSKIYERRGEWRNFVKNLPAHR